MRTEPAFWNQFEYADTLGSLIQPDPELTARLTQHVAQLDDGGDILLADVLDRADRVVVQAEVLSVSYHVVVANPPYMGGKNMDAACSVPLRRSGLCCSKSDLFAMFIERDLSLVKPGGYVSMITMQSWMFLSSFEDLRKRIVTESAVRAVAHLGTGAFESIAGAVVSTCAFVIEAAADPATPGVFIKLDDMPDEVSKNARLLETVQDIEGPARFELAGEQVCHIPGWTFSYWMSAELLAAFTGGRRLADVADPRQGLATADNGRFVRLWTEVSFSRAGIDLPGRREAQQSGLKWFPYNKGGSFRRWYGNQEFLVNWERDGHEIRAFGTESGGRPRSRAQNTDFYFRPAISWSKVGTAEPAFRYFPAGFVFDVAGTSVFATEHSTLLAILGFCNSVVARADAARFGGIHEP